MTTIRALAVTMALACAAALSARGQAPPARPDTVVAPVEAFALMQTLNGELLASRSATETLEKWCGDHRLAAEARVVAHLVRGVDTPVDAGQRRRLQAGAADPVKYRRVQLQCGSRVLSEADNWYVPSRLTPDMNRLLETTETPFGAVVRPLEPYRQTLAVTMLWSGGLPVPEALFAHRTVVYTRAGVPFSEVYEVYARQILP